MIIFVHLRQKSERRLPLHRARTGLWATWPSAGHPCPRQGLAPDDLYVSLPTQTLLRFSRKRELCQTKAVLTSTCKLSTSHGISLQPKPRAIYQEKAETDNSWPRSPISTEYRCRTACTWRALAATQSSSSQLWTLMSQREKRKTTSARCCRWKARWSSSARLGQVRFWTLGVIAASVCYSFILIPSHCAFGLGWGFFGPATQLYFKNWEMHVLG